MARRAGRAPASRPPRRRRTSPAWSARTTSGLAAAAEAGGNPVIPLVALLRERLAPSTEAARWLHRGLTSQDVVDTALMLCVRDAVAAMRRDLRRPDRVARPRSPTQHRDTPMVGADPHPARRADHVRAQGGAVADRRPRRGRRPGRGCAFPVQVGGAAGTMAAAVELAGADRTRAGALAAATAATLGLADVAAVAHRRAPRSPALGDAAGRAAPTPGGGSPTTCSTLARPEIGELAEGAGGGSSTMPHKANPVLSVLVRRAALTTPQLAATLHLAAAGAGRRAGRRRAGTPSGPRCAPCCAARSSPAPRPTDLLAGLRVARRPDGGHPRRRA